MFRKNVPIPVYSSAMQSNKTNEINTAQDIIKFIAAPDLV